MAKKFDAKAKAKRQKIILAVLGVVFLGVLAYEVPTLLGGKKPPAPTTAAPVTTPVPVPPLSGSGTPVSATPPAASGPLLDSDPAPEAGSGQLATFDRFVSKDPFAQQIPGAVAPKIPKPSDGPKDVVPPQSKSPASPKQPVAAATSAEISVNGVKETVAVSQTFPQADPVFVLVSLTTTRAKVAISGGSLDTGSATITLNKGKRVTLMNTADGTRYVVLLVSVS